MPVADDGAIHLVVEPPAANGTHRSFNATGLRIVSPDLVVVAVWVGVEPVFLCPLGATAKSFTDGARGLQPFPARAGMTISIKFEFTGAIEPELRVPVAGAILATASPAVVPPRGCRRCGVGYGAKLAEGGLSDLCAPCRQFLGEAAN